MRTRVRSLPLNPTLQKAGFAIVVNKPEKQRCPILQDVSRITSFTPKNTLQWPSQGSPPKAGAPKFGYAPASAGAVLQRLNDVECRAAPAAKGARSTFMNSHLGYLAVAPEASGAGADPELGINAMAQTIIKKGFANLCAKLTAPKPKLNCPLSIVHCPLSIVNCPLSIVNCPLSIVNCPLSIINKTPSSAPRPNPRAGPRHCSSRPRS
jgi:hypothetical protein